nr:hypothetical protein [uncultured Chryseobacterium sp.]
MSRSTRNNSVIQFIDFELILLRDYIAYVEDYFTSKEKEIQDNFQALDSTHQDDPIRDQIDGHHQSYFEVLRERLIDDDFYKEEFTQRFRYSLVIQIHSFYEKYLTRIGEYFKTKNGIKTVKGNFVEKLEKIITQADISKCSHYRFMVCFTELRNCIVHEEGVIFSDTDNIKRLVAFEELKNDNFIEFKETIGPKRSRLEVIINEKSLEVAVNKIEVFLREIDEIFQIHY